MTTATDRTQRVERPEAPPKILPRQRVETRDGIGLCTDVYLAADSLPAPAVLIRTPYGRHLPFLLVLAKKLNQVGLSAILQDSRGRYQSEGVPDWEREHDDGADTLAWIGEGDWCNGEVGLLGMSITSRSNVSLAAQEPPPGMRIGALLSIMGAIDFHAMFYEAGAVVLHWALPWCHLMGSKEVGRSRWSTLPWTERFRHLPLSSVPEDDRFDLGLWRFVLSHPESGGFWEDFSATGRLGQVAAPSLFLSGWYDFMLRHSLRGFQDLTSTAVLGSDRHKMVIGPWDHTSIFSSFNLGAAPRERSDSSAPDLMSLVVGWLESWLAPGRGAAEFDEQANVLLYVMNADRWVGADSFPLREAESIDWYLAGGEGGGEPRCGRLLPEAPREIGYDSFDYDPEEPLPTVGGAIWPLPAGRLAPGPTAQPEHPQRTDYLRYESEPLRGELILAGPLRVELWASTSARDTDFVVKLCDLDAGGTARIVQDGILRGRFREGQREQVLLDPHKPYRFDIDLGGTAYRFAPGHRLRLEVASSNFPKYDRNLNTGGPLYSAPTGLVAQQTVFFGGEMPSRLRLPVLSRAQLDDLRFDPFATWGAGLEPSAPSRSAGGPNEGEKGGA